MPLFAQPRMILRKKVFAVNPILLLYAAEEVFKPRPFFRLKMC